MNRGHRLWEICAEFGLLSVYLFGSRAVDGMRLLEGRPVTSGGSDLDVAVFGRAGGLDPYRLGPLQIALEDVFSPLRVDLVPLDRVDPLSQFAAIDGERVAAPNSTAADEKELEVMRRAADLLPIQREFEREEFGVHTS